jgi:uncharacterized protein YjdB
MLAKSPEDRWPGMTQALTALGAAPLAEDDPLRAELSRLATAGARTSFPSDGTGTRGKSSAVLQVTPPGMMRAVTILPPPPGLEVGDSFLLVARVHDGHAARLPTGAVEWSSDSPGVLRVNATKAVATAITPGSALIRAVCDGNEGRLRVTVAPPRADAIVVKSLEKPVTVGDEVRLEATPRDKRGRTVARPVTWRSEDDSVATISLDGVLVARSGGSTRITAELDEARAAVAITVLPPRVAALHISPAPESVVAGDSFALTATPLDRWAGPLTDRTVAWSVSDVNVAIVTAGGWVISRNPGLVVLTALCEGVSASMSVNVVERAAAPLPTIPQTYTSATATRSEPEPWERPPEPRAPEPRRSRSRPGWLVATGGALLVAGGFWLVGGRRPMEPAPPAESAVAARDSTPGEDLGAKPVAFGDTASATPARITIVQRPARPLTVGSLTQLAAEVRDTGGKLVPAFNVVWMSTNPAIASVDSSTGALRAVKAGRAEIVAAAGASRDSARIVVRPAVGEVPAVLYPASLSIEPHDPVKVGETVTLGLTALDRRGKPVRATRVTWSSSEPQVAAVNASTGRVRAYAPGSTLIIARSGSESAIASLSVLPADVASLNISGARPLKVGDTLELKAEPRDARGRPLADRPVTWATSEPEVALVDSASGVVIAGAPGSTQITATAEGKSGNVRVTVLPQPRTSRTELAAETVAQRAEDPPPVPPAAERQRLVDQMLAGIEVCYGALRAKDVDRVEELYRPETKSDREKLRKLGRILQTREWEAVVGEREDGAQRLEDSTAAMDFGFRLTWKDSFGGRIRSQPVFRAEFVKNGDQLDLSSCRIVGSPKL